uniref:Uncharacterized protein n=1 Tax=Alexandrium monilatum TaxID=311494 RepID=A0A7S4PYV8_9DINO
MAAPDPAGERGGEDEEPSEPPQPKVSPFYSVARQRARQQIRNARSCADMGLRAERLAAALEAAESVGLPELALQNVQEELQSAEGAARALGRRPSAREDPRPQSSHDGPRPLRPMTPVALSRLEGGVPVAPGGVALLLIRDDGIAEVRDAYDPRAQTGLTCRAFDAACVNFASAFAVLRDPVQDGAAREAFDHSALQDLLDDCSAFQAIIAVVDPLRPGGQVACSRLLSRGPEGPLCGVVAAVPGPGTPAPLAGPAFGALSVLLCLGGEGLGLGGRGWAGGGVFGRRLGLVDRAAAYTGGWPSVEVGRFAFQVVEAAVATRAPGGTAGSFLFGGARGSPEEVARASAVRAWLQGATQAPHTSQAWIEHFTRAGVAEGAHNDGPLWLHAAEKAGRWPGCTAPDKTDAAPEGKGEDDDAGGGDPEEAQADDDDAPEGQEGEGEQHEADGACAPEEPAVSQETPNGEPCRELPHPPPLAGVPPAKYAVPFGACATDFVGAATGEHADTGFTVLPEMSGPDGVEGGLPRGAEVLVVLDLADQTVPALPSGLWASWSSACSAARGVLVAAALLPTDDADDVEWHALLPTLHALILHFGLVIWLQHKAAPSSSLSTVLAALLDPAMHLSLLAAHLVPYRRLHFCTAYCGSSAQALAADLEAGRCAEAGSVEPRARAGSGGAREPGAEAEEAGREVRSLLSELAGHCGVHDKRAESRASGGVGSAAEAAPGGEDTPEGGAEGGIAEAEGEGGAEGGEEAAAEGEGGEEASDAEGGGAEGAAVEASGPPSALPTQRGVSVQAARLLSFVVGGSGAATALEGALALEGEQLQGSSSRPSLAYPIGAYGFGCVPLRPWGVSWAHPREDVVVFAVHTRAIAAIMRRIAAGVDEEVANARSK